MMGMFDIVNCCPNHEIQVKAWDRAMCAYDVGDRVPPLNGLHTYAIVSPRGTYILIVGLDIIGCSNCMPKSMPIFDKWGRQLE